MGIFKAGVVMRSWIRGVAALALLLGTVGQANAALFDVFVGYADGLRGVGFFPSPWYADSGVQFIGSTGSGLDAGAIRIDNTGALPLIVNDVSVNIDGAALGDIWAASFPLTLL